MIGYLKGKLRILNPTKIIIDVNGVGYEVSIPISTFEKINDQEFVELFIYTNVKEDAINLYGFYSEDEKEMFELLISVNGIGPKSAIGIISGITSSDLKNAIIMQDINRIVSIPGIGRKTAERLVLELKNKISSLKSTSGSEASNVKNDALAALLSLGFNIKSVNKILDDLVVAKPQIQIEDLIKDALSYLTNN